MEGELHLVLACQIQPDYPIPYHYTMSKQQGYYNNIQFEFRIQYIGGVIKLRNCVFHLTYLFIDRPK